MFWRTLPRWSHPQQPTTGNSGDWRVILHDRRGHHIWSTVERTLTVDRMIAINTSSSGRSKRETLCHVMVVLLSSRVKTSALARISPTTYSSAGIAVLFQYVLRIPMMIVGWERFRTWVHRYCKFQVNIFGIALGSSVMHSVPHRRFYDQN